MILQNQNNSKDLSNAQKKYRVINENKINKNLIKNLLLKKKKNNNKS